MLRFSATHAQKILHAEIPSAPANLGAAHDCEIPIRFPGVSRLHARVEPVDGGVRLVDLGSKNGLRRNGRRYGEITLRKGDAVHLGRVRLSVEDVDTSDALVAEPRRVRSPSVAPTSASGTDTVEAEELGGTPGYALSLIRDIERAGAVWSEPGSTLLHRAGEVVGSVSLFVLSHTPSGQAIRILSGESPTEAHASDAAALSGETGAGEIGIGVASDGAGLLVGRLGPRRDAATLVAVLGSLPVRVKPWRRDLFEYITHRLVPMAARRPATARARTGELAVPEGFVRPRSATMTALLESVRAAAGSGVDVLILGETGAGKEYVARIIHDSGQSARGPFVAINCAAIPSELLEAELFGVKARVATGVDARTGLFARAQGGTVFLDEIGDMAPLLQAKLLRALQEREVMPVGGERPEPIQVRVLSSTNKDLTTLVRSGHFRADLYYRLRGLEFIVPPLRERDEDIAVLALAFADRAAKAQGKEIAGLSRRGLRLLEEHPWPGNVRELRSELERAVLLCPDGGTLSSQYFEGLLRTKEMRNLDEPPRAITPAPPGAVRSFDTGPERRTVPTAAKLAALVDDLERRKIGEALEATGGNRAAAARRLGVTRNGLGLKIRRLGIEH